MKSKSAKLAAGLSAVLITNFCSAALYTVDLASDGLPDFSINPFETTLSAEDFYNYRSSPPNNEARWSYDGPVSLFDASSGSIGSEAGIHSFLVDSDIDGLFFITVFDSDPTFDLEGSVNLTGDTASFLVEDDGNDSFVNTLGTDFDFELSARNSRTDGFIIGSLDGAWSLDMEIDSFSGNNFSNWYIYGADNPGSDYSYTLNTYDIGNIENKISIAAVPEPSTYGLIGAAFLLGIVVHRRRSAAKNATKAA